MREMKPSGVEWIGDIPEDWGVVTIGSLFKVRNEKVNDTDYPPLSVTKGGIVPQMENVAKTDANDNRKQVLTNDFVINSRSDRKQSCGVSPLDGSVSLINIVLYPNKGAPVNPALLNYLMKNAAFAEEFYRWGHGIVADLWTTRWQEMKNIFLPLPSRPEQEAIVAFLDRKCGQVDALVKNVQAQIEQLKAYKQSLISETVTKGLNPNAPMKDSGVEWIGKIPQGWEVRKLKYIANSFTKGAGITKEQIASNGDTPCVRYGEIYTKYNFTFSACETRTNRGILGSCQFFSHGDVLFTCTGELVEEIGKSIAYLGYEECLAGGDIVIMKHSQNPKFLGFSLASLYAQEQKSRGQAKLKVVHTSASALGNIYVVLPPLAEQEAIADFLDRKCAQIDRLIAVKQAKIEQLEAYKKSLIYEVVTGKIACE